MESDVGARCAGRPPRPARGASPMTVMPMSAAWSSPARTGRASSPPCPSSCSRPARTSPSRSSTPPTRSAARSSCASSSTSTASIDRAGELGQRFAAMADRFSMRWHLTRAADLKRVAIMVSRTDHALQEILWRAQSGELRADIRMVISNHPDAGAARPGGACRSTTSRSPRRPRTRPRRHSSACSPARPTWSSWPGTCRSCRRGSCPSSARRSSTSTTASCRRSRAPTLPPGRRTGRQAHRRDRPLRHRGTGRGTDHRAGHRPGGPPVLAR